MTTPGALWEVKRSCSILHHEMLCWYSSTESHSVACGEVHDWWQTQRWPLPTSLSKTEGIRETSNNLNTTLLVHIWLCDDRGQCHQRMFCSKAKYVKLFKSMHEKKWLNPSRNSFTPIQQAIMCPCQHSCNRCTWSRNSEWEPSCSRY